MFAIKSADQLGSHLRALRVAQGLTQTDVGLRLGVAAPRISDIENDPSAVGFGHILHLIHALGAQLVITADAQQPKKSPSDARAGEW
jgi:transcriptional regulator with XRE-family HTH domain